MSSYDKYFSEINKSHMWSLVKDIVLKETAYDISHVQSYIDMFHTKYPQIFYDTKGETIVDCNRDVIDTICPILIQKIRQNRPHTSVPHKLQTIPETSETSETSESSSVDKTEETTLHVYSSQRTSNSHNRYNFTVMSPDVPSLTFHKLTLPEEDHSLFGLPVIKVRFTIGDQEYVCICELENTKYLGDRNYITYISTTQGVMKIDHPDIHIEILDNEGTQCLYDKDRFECLQIKQMEKHETRYLCIQLSLKDISQCMEKDKISLYDETSQLVGKTTICQKVGPYLVCEFIEIAEGSGNMTIINVSLQNHLVFRV